MQSLASFSPTLTFAVRLCLLLRTHKRRKTTKNARNEHKRSETQVREHASRAALQGSPRFAGIGVGSDVVKAAVAEEVRAFLERRVAAGAAAEAGVKKEEADAPAARDPPPTTALAAPPRRPPGRGGRDGARVKKEEEGGEEEEEGGGGAGARGGRVARRAPRKASTASFIVSDDADEDEDGDYEEEDDEDGDDDDDSESEEGESSDDDDESAAPPPKKKAKRGGRGGRPAATAATSVGESPAVFRENGGAGAGGAPPPPASGAAAARAAAARSAADAARPSPSIPAVLRVPLGDRRFASVSRLGGTRRLDIREWYLPKGEGGEEGDGGGLKPGLKGVSLGAAAVKALRARAAELDEALSGGRDFSFALEEKKPASGAAGGAGGASISNADAAEGAAGSQGGGGGGSQGGGWQQQKNRAPTKKVAATSLWQNVWRVDLREHYLAAGGGENNWRPTKKGISLSPAVWSKLLESLPELESAVIGGGGGEGRRTE